MASRVTESGFPDFAFLRVGEFFAGPGAGFGGYPIEMARGAACGGACARLFPAGFEPAEFFEAHEDGVEGARGEAGLLAEGIAVVPGSGLVEERFEER
jgi:hypothetical protein